MKLARRFIGVNLLLCFACIKVYAQVDPKVYDPVVKQVIQFYNARQPDKIYEFTAPAYQAKMTGTQFATGMNKFYVKAGQWKTAEVKATTDKGIDYQAAFEQIQQVFSMELDQNGQISRLNFAAIPLVAAVKPFKVADNDPMADRVDSLVEKLVRPYIQKGNTSGLCLALIRGGQIKRYNYGESIRGNKILPDADSTVFEIGSVTKTFNSLLLAQQVLKGSMKLTDPVNKYLPDSIPTLIYSGVPITLKNLANHTSGLPRLPANIFNGEVNPQDPYKHYVPDSLYSFLVHYKPTVIPGTVFSYSNYGAGLLGTLLERQNHATFEQLVVERICKPLKMYHTTIILNSTAQKNFAQGYNEKGEPTAPWDLASLKGSGAIRSTLNDMVIYAQAEMNLNTILSGAMALTHQSTFESKENSMGLGWRIFTNGKVRYWHHSGGTGGFRSFVGFDKARKVAVVILSNAAEDVTSIGQSILSESL